VPDIFLSDMKGNFWASCTYKREVHPDVAVSLHAWLNIPVNLSLRLFPSKMLAGVYSKVDRITIIYFFPLYAIRYTLFAIRNTHTAIRDMSHDFNQMCKRFFHSWYYKINSKGLQSGFGPNLGRLTPIAELRELILNPPVYYILYPPTVR